MNEGKKELLGGLLRLSLGTIGVTIGEAELEKMAEKGTSRIEFRHQMLSGDLLAYLSLNLIYGILS